MNRLKSIFVAAVLVSSTALTGCASVTTNAIREDGIRGDQAALAQAKGHPILIDQVTVSLDPEFTNEPRAYAPAVYRAMMADNLRQAAQNAGLQQGQGPAYRANVTLTRILMRSGRVAGIRSIVTVRDPAGGQVAQIPIETVTNGTRETQTSNFKYMHRYAVPGEAATIVALLQSIQATGSRPAKLNPVIGFQPTYYGLEYPMSDATTARYAAGGH